MPRNLSPGSAHILIRLLLSLNENTSAILDARDQIADQIRTLLPSANYTLWSILTDIKSHNSDDTAGAKKKQPNVVTLGYVQSAIFLLRVLWNQNLPNYEISETLCNKYGPIVTIRTPFKRQVTLNVGEINAAKRIMSSSAWADRFPSDYYFHKTLDGEPVGIFWGNGGYWKEGRKLALGLLHQFGFFREETMERIIQHEARELVEKGFSRAIQKQGGEPAVMTMQYMFETYTLNVVYQVISGKRFQRDDPTVQRLISTINATNDEFRVGTYILDVLPWLQCLPFLKFQTALTAFNEAFKDHLRKELIEPRRKTGNYRTNPVDFADHFLLEMDRRAGEKPCYLTDTNFLACIRDLLAGGTDTTNSALEHGILQVCLYPAIQTKIQEEIDQVIGATREPCYEDRKSMPYTQAALLEILRYCTPVALISRCPLKDGEIQGRYLIPKDSLVGINQSAIHHSSEIWSDPDNFRPERFLSEDNKSVNLDKIMPFGYGKRVCVGEFPAKISFFIFFVSLLQKFTFELSKAHGPPCLKNKIVLSRGPFPYYVKIAHRSNDAQKKE